LEQFDVFTSGLFRDMNFSNMFVAGGAVLATALRVEQEEELAQNQNMNMDSDESSVDTESDIVLSVM
jgi:hypothetical protein